MSQTKAQLVSGTTAQDLTVDNINTTSVNSGQISNRNKVINGSMMIHQRGDAAATGSAAYLSCDRFLTNNGSGAQVAVSKSTDTPDGFSASTKWDCTTADSSVAANEYFIIQHRMEGQNLQDFEKGSSSAKQYALSFYIKATKTGVYTIELEDTDNARVCSKTITVSDNNWNRYTIIYPADTTGTTNNDNGNSLTINFWLLAGSDYNSGTLQSSAWGARTNANRASSSNVNALDSTSNDFLLTGVQLEVGGTVTDFEHRSFAQELQLCQRYYYVLASGATKFMCIGDFWIDGQADGGIVLPVEMRATPTLDHTNGADYYRVWTNGTNSHIDGAISLWNRSHNKAVTWYATPDTNRTAGHANRWITNNASTHFAFSAEL